MLGTILNNTYRLDRELTAGGMGQVYVASHVRITGRAFAIKRLRPELAGSSTFQDRFRSEAEAMMKMEHVNIVRIEDFLIEDDNYYLVMELVEGFPLDQVIAQRAPISAEETHTLAVQLLEGIEFCHERGVIHRDLKPSNLLLNPEGILKITDFGIALQNDVVDRLTQPGTVLGTPDYMSPEQIVGKGVGERSDLYSVGVILYEMLRGTPPFPRTSDSDSSYVVLFAHVHKEPPPLELPNLPLYLKIVVERCLEKDPDHRFQTAGELLLYLKDRGNQTNPEYLLPELGVGEHLKQGNPKGNGTANFSREQVFQVARDAPQGPSGDLLQATTVKSSDSLQEARTSLSGQFEERKKKKGSSAMWLFLIAFLVVVGSALAFYFVFRVQQTHLASKDQKAASSTLDAKNLSEDPSVEIERPKLKTQPPILKHPAPRYPKRKRVRKRRKRLPKAQRAVPIRPEAAQPSQPSQGQVDPSEESESRAGEQKGRGRGPGGEKAKTGSEKGKGATVRSMFPRSVPSSPTPKVFWPEPAPDLCIQLLNACFKGCYKRLRGTPTPQNVCRQRCWKERSKGPRGQICPPPKREVY